jgi:hypothetical protein
MANRYEGRMGRGASRVVKAKKRQEAEKRNTEYQLAAALWNSAEGNVESLGDFTQYADQD